MAGLELATGGVSELGLQPLLERGVGGIENSSANQLPLRLLV